MDNVILIGLTIMVYEPLYRVLQIGRIHSRGQHLY